MLKMAAKMFLADVPEDLREEISVLYGLGLSIEEIEYVISKKLKFSQTIT